MSPFTESVVEDAALAWLEALGYAVLHGPDIAVGQPAAERTDPNYRDVVLEGRLRQRARPAEPRPAARSAGRRLPQADPRGRAVARRTQSRRCIGCWSMASRSSTGARTVRSPARRRASSTSTRPENNDWLAVNQFTVREGQHTRRPDVVLFVNGLPLAVIELKNPADENATIWSRLPAAPDLSGTDPGAVRDQRRAGRVRRGAGAHRRARRGQGMVQALAHDHRRARTPSAKLPELQVVLEGVFEQRRFLDLLRYFIVFEDPRRWRASSSRRWPAITSSTP